MHDQTKQIPDEDERCLQRAIVLQTLRSDHRPRWTSRELQAELGEDDTAPLLAALARLRDVGVLNSADATSEAVECSTATRYLDQLQLIAL